MTSVFAGELMAAPAAVRARLSAHIRPSGVRSGAVTSAVRAAGLPTLGGGGRCGAAVLADARSRLRPPEVPQRLVQVLVAPAGQADEDQLGLQVGRASERMRRLECRDD